jgi:hypothetical protein
VNEVEAFHHKEYKRFNDMVNLIGDKNNFGVEYQIHPSRSHVMGNMRLWLGGKFVGAFEDVDMLGIALYQLEGGVELKECHLPNMVADQIYALMISEDIPNVRHFMPGPAFDDFIIFWYLCNKKFILFGSLLMSHIFNT